MIHIFDDEDKTAAAAADFFISRVSHVLDKGRRCSVALSGGSSPKKLFAHLVSRPSDVDWPMVDFFFGDERYVPNDHPESNFRMARENLFDPLSIADEHIHPVNTLLSPEKAAEEYEAAIKTYFHPSSPAFDLVLLGLGDDAHTASLFPDTSVVKEKVALVKEVYVEKLKAYRITFTSALINNASTVVFLVFGSSKASAVKNVLRQPADPLSYPAQLINPSNGEMFWFMDRLAASMI